MAFSGFLLSEISGGVCFFFPKKIIQHIPTLGAKFQQIGETLNSIQWWVGTYILLPQWSFYKGLSKSWKTKKQIREVCTWTPQVTMFLFWKLSVFVKQNPSVFDLDGARCSFALGVSQKTMTQEKRFTFPIWVFHQTLKSFKFVEPLLFFFENYPAPNCGAKFVSKLTSCENHESWPWSKSINPGSQTKEIHSEMHQKSPAIQKGDQPSTHLSNFTTFRSNKKWHKVGKGSL